MPRPWAETAIRQLGYMAVSINMETKGRSIKVHFPLHYTSFKGEGLCSINSLEILLSENGTSPLDIVHSQLDVYDAF